MMWSRIREKKSTKQQQMQGSREASDARQERRTVDPLFCVTCEEFLDVCGGTWKERDERLVWWFRKWVVGE
jgi:hypothetical protein